MRLQRTTQTTSLENGTLVAYVAVFNVPTIIREQGRVYREVIRPGAFKRSLALNKDIPATIEHGKVIARTGDGTARLFEDSIGLRLEIPNASQDLQKFSGGSFTFEVPTSHLRQMDRGFHEIKDGNLIEVTLTNDPAYPQTYVQNKSTKNIKKLQLEMLSMLPI